MLLGGQAPLKTLKRLPLRLFTQECYDIVLQKDLSATDASAYDLPLLSQFHRGGAVDL